MISKNGLFLVSALIVAYSLIFKSNQTNQILQSAFGFSIISFLSTLIMIPIIGPSFIKIGLKGKDLSKKNPKVIPESMGAIVAITYLFTMYIFVPFIFYKYVVSITSGGGNRDEGYEMINIIETSKKHKIIEKLFPHSKLAQYLSALLCLQSMMLLGLADDLFDIRWRNKFFLPAIASIPLLVVYYIDFGVTWVLVPSFIKNWFGIESDILNLGPLYYIYMASVAIFCPNSINILAGINGLEVGQSIIISILLLINDSIYLFKLPKDHPSIDSHLFSSILLIPFLGASFGLLYYNWFPSKVFVGDTYCYFAGMVFAVVGILGHFSKTLLLFFIPQIFNFLYSIPQLIGIIPCPRHRLPKFNEKDGLMYPSRSDIIKPLPTLITNILLLLEKVHLIKLWKEQIITEITTKDDIKIQTKKIKINQCSNLTMINLVLVIVGPLREDKLTLFIMGLLFIVGLIALVLRHIIAILIFGIDNITKV